ncbi:hypothetical protein FOMPIDRAFT_1053451 [Fomitopsis schrenkii]|uniref:DUF6534 domain-containing protein n=1 Tax=Fomitopsis schrenkii TaxID=2126942 RepID=S8DSM4_FOMSC|nr:hypothetical protein FOMPIDRAFT_1053451 [Fomitopsis schrenkii]
MAGSNAVPTGFGDAFLNTTFVGEFLLFVLYGCTLGQTVHYYSQYKDDRLQWKGLVAVLLLLDTAKVAAGAEILYYYTVTNHQAPYNIAALPPAYTILAVIGIVTVLLSQCFYLRTIYSVCTRRRNQRRAVIAVIGVFLALLGFAMGIVWITELNIHDAATEALKGISARSGVIQLTANIATDLYITIALTWILRNFQSEVETRGLLRDYDSNLGSIVSRLFAYSASRGALLLVLQIVEITIVSGIQWIGVVDDVLQNLLDDKHKTYLTNIVWLPQSTVYCNSVLAACVVPYAPFRVQC